MEEMTSRERVDAVIRHEEPDRVPIIFFSSTLPLQLIGATMPEVIRNPEKVANCGISLFEKYSCDFVLVGVGLEPLFVKKTYDYRGYVLEEPEGYERIEVLDPRREGRMPIVLEALRKASEKMNGKVPVGTAIMHPLGTVLELRGREKGLGDILLYPDLLHKGLETVSQSLIDFSVACVEEGADFIVFAPGGYGGVLSPQQALEFGIKYDAKVLREVHKAGAFIVAHFCGSKPYIDLCLREYPPVQILNWWDRGSNLSLKAAKEKYGREIALCAGLDQTRTLLFGSPKDVEEEAKDAIKTAAVEGGFILAPGCEVAPQTPQENILAMINAAKKYGGYPLDEKMLRE
jgi:uroporphyrinogen decarboxylase